MLVLQDYSVLWTVEFWGGVDHTSMNCCINVYRIIFIFIYIYIHMHMYNQITLSLYIHVRHIQTYYYISINIYIYTYTHIMYNIYIYSYLHYKSISLSLSLSGTMRLYQISLSPLSTCFSPFPGLLKASMGRRDHGITCHVFLVSRLRLSQTKGVEITPLSSHIPKKGTISKGNFIFQA